MFAKDTAHKENVPNVYIFWGDNNVGSNRLNYSSREAKVIRHEECLCHFMRNYRDSDVLGEKHHFKLKVLISQSLNSSQRVSLYTPNNVNFFKRISLSTEFHSIPNPVLICCRKIL